MARAGNPKPAIVAAALALALAAALLATPPPADAASRYKTVTKTFSNRGFIDIPLSGTATPYPSEIVVGGLRKGRILDANLTLRTFSHTSPQDVDVLVSHRGANRLVMSDVGKGDEDLVYTLTLDDEAAVPLPSDGTLATGTYRPTNVYGFSTDSFPAPAPALSGLSELSGFKGMNPNGPWYLWVRDDVGFDKGQFAGGWSVTIKARVLR